ncbi:hypothetical protein GKZ28_27725 [Clostridium chromiireducens]|uniref:Transposase n=1 Tax=Clostridium chromiireducens TaxID=225345 RepID=A0A964W5L2_9CLOT|nr:hypothetical protein [Clostridium chromiireducens]MVX67403.1 hypothetical protein [Clostridium chromiireducens]
MPRKKHEWYMGAKLHVIARGNHRNNIFRDETDYELYLNYLNDIKSLVNSRLAPPGKTGFSRYKHRAKDMFCALFFSKRVISFPSNPGGPENYQVQV